MASREILQEIAECAICLSQMDGKIYLCPNGHDICECCFEQLSRRDPRGLQCPTCKVRYHFDSNCEPTRNRSLERLLRQATLPCRFADEGCKQAHLCGAHQRNAHSRNCKHRLFKCPFGVCHTRDAETAQLIGRAVDCNVGLPLEQLLEHCRTQHGIDTFHSDGKMAFHFELDDMSEGEGHWRMFLRQCCAKPASQFGAMLSQLFSGDSDASMSATSSCDAATVTERSPATDGDEWADSEKCVFLMGFKSSDNEISLCARTVLASQVGKQYSIEVSIPGETPILFTAPLRDVSEPLGAEAKAGQVLTLSPNQVSVMRRQRLGQPCATVMKVCI